MSVPGFLIADVHKLTALDFPGVVSAIVFTQGCNFHCPYCHNPQLIPEQGKQPPLDVEEVLSFLRKRAGLLDGVVISGGEPSIRTGLPHFCREVKRLGYAVKLDTNGSRPEVLERLLADSLVDYVAMDCKTGADNYGRLCREEDISRRILQSAEILRRSGIAHEFRTTCIAPFVSEEAVTDMAVRMVVDSAWYFQKGTLSPEMNRGGMEAASSDEINHMMELALRMGARAYLR